MPAAPHSGAQIVRTVFLMGDGSMRTERAALESHITDDRYRKLIYYMPTALWQVDSRAAGEAFNHLRAQGVTDTNIAAYLDAHQDLVEHACDTVLVTEVNQAAVSLFRGRDVAELVRPVRYLFVATPDMAKRVMVAHFDGRRSYAEQAKILTLDGETRDVVLTVTYPTPDEQQETTFITIRDITERLRTEAQLRQIQADYAHAARISTLGEMATSIAHEVQQPLAAIVTNGETSLRWLSRGDPNVAKLKQLTTRIISSARRASDIIERIRGMAQRREPERTELDLHDVVDEALHFVRHEIESKTINLSVRGFPGRSKVLGDRIQLQQVIVNLLVNSIQAIAQADPPERRIFIAAESADAGTLTLSIRDSGSGIAPDSLGRLFESFFTTKKEGMGIGLAVCQSIIAAHGGSIEASNHPDGGAYFRFSLPATPPAKSTIAASGVASTQ
jgi:two-component system, LuxR family, sensor kinase FixL